MQRVKDEQRQNEIERDVASRFVFEQYVSNGYHMHFHRNLEIYGVVNGTVSVTIAGENMSLSSGQIAVINSLENHGYEIDGETEIFYIHIGTRYLRDFFSLYSGKRLPRWLLDAEYNKIIYARVKENMIDSQAFIPELKRIGIVSQLFSDIIEHYGIVDGKRNDGRDSDLIAEIVQYIYEHYNENITLETLSKAFFISPKALSKKIGKSLNVDLRVFVNDIRVNISRQRHHQHAFELHLYAQ